MNQKMKKIWRIPLIILGVVTATVLLSLLQYLLYNRNHLAGKRTIEWRGEGKLLLEDGSEYNRSVPTDLYGVYLDYGMFYPEKDEIRMEMKYDGNLCYDGSYYPENMEERLCSSITYEDGTVLDLEAYECSLVYVDYQEDGASSFIFYLRDISKIIEDEKPGQKGLLVLTDQDLYTPEDVIRKAMQETDKTDPVWENYIAGLQ